MPEAKATAAVVADVVKIEERLSAMQSVADSAKGSVKTLQWIASPFLALGALAIVWLAGAIGDLKSADSSHIRTAADFKSQHTADIARIEKSLADSVLRQEKQSAEALARIEKSLAESVTRIERSFADALTQSEKRQATELARIEKHFATEMVRIEKEHASDMARIERTLDKIQTKLIGMLETPSKVTTAFTPGNRYHEHVGKLARYSKDSITLTEPLTPGVAEYTYPLAIGVRVLVRGELAKLEDLKPGMFVRILHATNQKVQLVETVPDEELLPMPPKPTPK